MKNPTPRQDTTPVDDNANSVIGSALATGTHVPFPRAVALNIREMDVLEAIMARNESFSNNPASTALTSNTRKLHDTLDKNIDETIMMGIVFDDLIIRSKNTALEDDVKNIIDEHYKYSPRLADYMPKGPFDRMGIPEEHQQLIRDSLADMSEHTRQGIYQEMNAGFFGYPKGNEFELMIASAKKYAFDIDETNKKNGVGTTNNLDSFINNLNTVVAKHNDTTYEDISISTSDPRVNDSQSRDYSFIIPSITNPPFKNQKEQDNHYGIKRGFRGVSGTSARFTDPADAKWAEQDRLIPIRDADLKNIRDDRAQKRSAYLDAIQNNPASQRNTQPSADVNQNNVSQARPSVKETTDIPYNKVMLQGSNGNKYPDRVKYGKTNFQGFIGENINGDPVYASEDGLKRVAGDIKGKLQRDNNFDVNAISVNSRASANVLYTALEVDAAIEKNKLNANQNNLSEGNNMSQNQTNTAASQGYDNNNSNSFNDGPPAHFADMNDSYGSGYNDNGYNDGPPSYFNESTEGASNSNQTPTGAPAVDPMDSYPKPGDANFDPTGVLDGHRARAAQNREAARQQQADQNQAQNPQQNSAASQGFSDDPYDHPIDPDEELANQQHHANQQTVPIRDANGNVIGVTTIDPNAANNAPMDPADLAEIERQLTDGDRLSRLYNRLAFMESLRISTGVNPDARFHKNMSSDDAHDQLERIRDGILDMTNKGLVGAEDSATANKFISGMINEVAGNPSTSLDMALMSENVISDEDFNHPSTQATVGSFREKIEGKEDALLASLFLADIKSKGEYPFAIDLTGKPPISASLNSSIVRPLNHLSILPQSSMRNYVEIKFAHENYDALSDEYKNGITKQELTTSLDDYNKNGYFKRTRETNRELEKDKSPSQNSVFGISGVPISDLEAVDSVMAINDSVKEGNGPFSSNSANPQVDIAHVISAKKALDYQLENASYLPKSLRAPYSSAVLNNTLHQLGENHDFIKIKEQYGAIKEKGMADHEWEKISTPHKIAEANTAGTLTGDGIELRSRLAFHIKNYDQLGSFNNQLDQRGQDNNYPSQSEMRLALSSLDDIYQNSINPASIVKLHDLNPASPTEKFSGELDFTQSDADKIFLLIDTQLERPGMSDQDVINLDELSDIIEDKGFVKGSDYEVLSSDRLDSVATAHSNTLSAAKINSLASHRSHASNGVAANLGSGSDVSKQVAAGDAHDIAISKIANAIIDGVAGDSDPKKTASHIQNILSDPDLQEAAQPLTAQSAISAAQSGNSASETGTINNTTSSNTSPTVDNATPSDTNTDNPESSNPETGDNEPDAGAEDKKSNGDKNSKKILDPNHPDYEEDGATRKQPSTALPVKPPGGDYMTGAAGVLAALGALTSSIIRGSMRGAIEPPHPSTYDKDYYKNGGGSHNPANNPNINSNTGAGNGTGGNSNSNNPADNRSYKSKLNPNTRNHLVTMQTSILAFESSSKLLEDNKISNTLSMQDKRLLEKDLKKQLSVFGNSSELAAEGLRKSAPDMSSSLRLSVSDHLTKSSKDMKSLFDNSQDKGLFSANDRQKEIMQNAMGAIGGAVTSLRNSIMVGVRAIFSPSRG